MRLNAFLYSIFIAGSASAEIFPQTRSFDLLARRPDSKEGATEGQKEEKEVKEQKGERKTFSGKAIRDDHDNNVAPDSSEALREGKNFDLVAELAGTSVFPIPSYGITAGYYFRPDMVLEMNAAVGKADLTIFEIYSRVYSLRLKKYWGNSFYTNTGLAYRKIGGRTKLNEIIGGLSTDEIEISATSLALDLAIGNKWQFSYFTIGCDWVGFLAPIAKLSTKDNYPDTASQERKDDKEALNRLAMHGSLQLLRFYLGASF